ncbi:hypothetical protein B0H14DRAFT_2623461 [Mycena olivaceomarginata]|nr:hypothetical protein B0H14DRAFT_2623461 [Mycena olivaceomarginata]
MAPPSWTTPEQRTWLHSWMLSFIQKQAEGKLNKFWPAMMEAWFKEFPEHEALGLTLPSDPNAAPLTDAELVLLGAAIKAKRSKIENWFRNQRQKTNKATGNVASSPAIQAKVKEIFQQSIPKRVRAHQAVEIFQKRNGDLIKNALEAAGYDLLNADSDTDEDDDWVDESGSDPVALDKRKKSKRMRLRSRVVSKLWEVASPEERKIAEEAAEEEKKTMAEEAEQVAKRTLEAKTPLERQQGIDALDGVYGDVHRATYAATGWMGMSIFGGPNPQMGGNLSLKIVCFGETPGGNDFEKSCVDFDQHITQAFQAFLRLCFSEEDAAALSLPTADVGSDARPVERIMAPVAAPEAEKPKTKKSTKTKSKKKTAAAPANKGPLLPPVAEQDETEMLEPQETVPPVEEEDAFDEDLTRGDDAWTSQTHTEFFGSNDFNDNEERPASDGRTMLWTPAEAAAAAAASADRAQASRPGDIMVIDPRLIGLTADSMMPDAVIPNPVPPPHVLVDAPSPPPPVTTPPRTPLATPPPMNPILPASRPPVKPPAKKKSGPVKVPAPKKTVRKAAPAKRKLQRHQPKGGYGSEQRCQESTNNNRKWALVAAEADRVAKEQEVATAKAKQLAKGWVEKTVDGGSVVTFLPLCAESREASGRVYSAESARCETGRIGSGATRAPDDCR